MSGKERSTFSFFLNIRERINASFVSLNYYITQALTGHDNFKAKLASLSPATDERCECSRKDTVQYHILDCPVFEPQRPKRIALVEITGGKIWPEAARFNLIFSAKVFSLFNTFRKKVLSIKGTYFLDLVQPELPEFLMMGMGCNLLRSTHFQTRWKWLVRFFFFLFYSSVNPKLTVLLSLPS